MQDIQTIFNHIQEIKKEQKKIRTGYREALSGSSEYQEIAEKLKTLRERRKQIETSIKQDFDSEWTKLEDYAIDLESEATLLSDAALSKLMKGETVQVSDEYNNNYEPIFSVKFKKAG